jgi:HK97 family phage major capsid protein
MPTFGEVVARGDTAALMPEDFSNAILETLNYTSAAQSLFSPIKMSRKQTRMPVLAGLATAYFVNGNTGSDTGLIQTTSVKWDNKYLNAEELAVIVPIPKAVLDDTDYDVWGRIKPQCEQALARALDAAVFFGINKPQSWGPSIYGGIQNALVAVGANAPTSPVKTMGVTAQAAGGVAEDINCVFEFVENSGFPVNMLLAPTTFKAPLRRIRNTLGDRLLDVQVGPATGPANGAIGHSGFVVNGEAVTFGVDGLWPAQATGIPMLFAGDRSEGIIGYRDDIEVEVLNEAVIQDATGRIIFNLAQQNMVALKLVCRFAWEVGNTINWLQPNEAARFPFAALVHA